MCLPSLRSCLTHNSSNYGWQSLSPLPLLDSLLTYPQGSPGTSKNPRLRVSPATSSCPPGTRWPAAQPNVGLWGFQPADSLFGHSARPTHTCFFYCQAIPLTLVTSPVTPASRRGKQTDISHQNTIKSWGSGAFGTVCPRRGVAPEPRRGCQNYSLLACRQGPSSVGSSRRGAGRTGQ